MPTNTIERRMIMYAITGITGKVGGELARTLLAAREPVRAVVPDAKKGQKWAALGCEVALAEMEDASALADAFTGATAVFILPPAQFDPEPGYPEARAVINSVVEALSRQTRKNSLPVDDRCRRRTGKSIIATRNDGSGTSRASNPAYDPAACLVHRQCDLGRCFGSRYRPHPQLPAADRQGIPDGRGERCWAHGSGTHSGGLDWDTHRRAGGPTPHNA
jgi:NAD(P)H-binding